MSVTPPPRQLTVDRLFDAPALSGPTIASLKISPDSSRITFLRGKAVNKDRLDLWEHSLQDGSTRLLVDADEVSSDDRRVSAEEQARRERQRKAALTGIIDYQFSPGGDSLLFPAGDDLYRCRIGERGAKHWVERIPTGGPVTDPSISPNGTYVAYVREQDLYLYEIASKQTRRLTPDGGGVIKNGMAEYVAQEEMDRDTGYWWAPDDKHIAFARVDETPVGETARFEVSADNVTTVLQRYPAAGRPNVLIKIGVVDVQSLETTWMDLGTDPDIYVARVDWLPDGRTLAVQRQSRDQKTLELLFVDALDGRSQLILTETSQSWIDLNHELSFLKQSPEFVWASNRSGFTHLYLYGTDGRLIRQIIGGNWNVDDFRGRAIKAIDEHQRLIFYVSTEVSPTERHLHRAHMDSGHTQRITQGAGIHAVSMSSNGRFFVDSFNSDSQPPQVGVFDQDGRLRHWLMENSLDADHPDAPYVSTNASSEYGKLTAADGQELYYRLFRPSHFDPSRKHPAIIDVYGGPGVQRVLKSWSGGSFTQILTRAGYVVMMLDNRGTAFRGTAFQSPISGRLGEVEVADQLVGAQWLAAQPFIDARRMGVFGWSYGGYMALMLMFKAPDVFKAGISGAPVTDWHLYDTHYTERYLGKPQHNASGYEASAVMPYTQGLGGPLLLMHGMADDNVLLSNSTKLMRALQDTGKPFDVMMYPGAKHGLLRQNDGRHAYAMMLRFFDHHLTPGSP